MGKWCHALGALVLLAGLVVGLPVLLVEVAGWPFPAEVPDWGHIWQMLQQGDIPSEPVVKTLAVILWALWVAIVWSFAWELATTLTTTSRGDRPVRAAAPFVPPAVSLGVGRLVAAILAVGVVTSSVMASSSLAAPLPTPVLVTDAPSLHVPRPDAATVAAPPRAAAVRRWVAGPTDTVWDVASTALGDATRVEEIVAMNAGVRPARVLRAGQVLELPADAIVPADRRPAQESPASSEALPATTVVVQPGDTLWDHASGRLRLAGADADPSSVAAYVDAVVAANPHVIDDADIIVAGDVLSMPAVLEDPPAASTTTASSYRVRTDDTLWDILHAHYGAVDADLVWRIAEHNGLADPDAIDVDQLLVLPDLEPTPAAPPAPAPETTPPPAPERPAPDAPAPPPPAITPTSITPTMPTTPSTSTAPSAPSAPTAPTAAATISPASATSEPTESAAATDSTEPAPADPIDPTAADVESPSSPSPIGFGEAALLSAGVLALLASRRRARLRAARPRARLPEPRPAQVATERALRAVDATERLLRVDVAIRAAAASLIDGPAQIALVRSGVDGAVELTLTAEAALPAPWASDQGRWVLPGSTPIELLADAARTVGAPCVAFTQLGVDDHGRDVFADLEALGALAVVADDLDEVEAVIRGLAATLATSALAEMVNLVGVGLDERAFLDHRCAHMAATVDEAVAAATMLVGTTADARQSTFVLRARHTGGEAWEPAIILTGVDVASQVREEHVRSAARRRGGVAMVVGGDVPAAPWTLRADGEHWRLEPLGITLTPVTLTVAELVEVREMLRFAEQPLLAEESVPEDVAVRSSDHDDDVTANCPVRFEDTPWSLLVRLLGPVDVVDRCGVPVRFERSKTLELIAWLSLHRGRSTRAAARTALWELDVRDTTFANVVSEARRAMARQVEPPEHEEWVGRTLTEELPLHELVVSDADLVRARLEHARLQPPELAIETLRPAVELIRDVPLAGTGYLWPDAEGTTSQLVLLATSAATELAGHYLSTGDVDGVFWATGRGLQVLPGHEALIALRMRAHAGAGDLAGVRTEWESYERVLHADPWGDCEPAPKLVLLRRELLSPAAS